MYIEEAKVKEVSNSTTYRKQRGKPMPSLHHGSIQNKLSFLLTRDYSKEYQSFSELSLAIEPKGATPDLAIYNKMHFDYAKDEDVTKMTELPLTTIEILSPKQVLNSVISKIKKSYFPSGIKSAWLIIPPLKTAVLLLPKKTPQYFTSGKIKDPTTGIELSIDEIFEV